MHAKSITLMASIVVGKEGFYFTFRPHAPWRTERRNHQIHETSVTSGVREEQRHCAKNKGIARRTMASREEQWHCAKHNDIARRTKDNCPPAVRMFTNNGTKDLIDICRYVNRWTMVCQQTVVGEPRHQRFLIKNIWENNGVSTNPRLRTMAANIKGSCPGKNMLNCKIYL